MADGINLIESEGGCLAQDCCEESEMKLYGILRTDMQKVETLPPSDFQVKIYAFWKN